MVPWIHEAVCSASYGNDIRNSLAIFNLAFINPHIQSTPLQDKTFFLYAPVIVLLTPNLDAISRGSLDIFRCAFVVI
jgi:hypothetical protein